MKSFCWCTFYRHLIYCPRNDLRVCEFGGDENFSRTSIIHFSPLYAHSLISRSVTVTMMECDKIIYIWAGYLWRENPLLKCQLLHDLFHFSSSFFSLSLASALSNHALKFPTRSSHCHTKKKLFHCDRDLLNW